MNSYIIFLCTVLENTPWVYQNVHFLEIIRKHYKQQHTSIYPVSSLCVLEVSYFTFPYVTNHTAQCIPGRGAHFPCQAAAMSGANQPNLKLYYVCALFQTCLHCIHYHLLILKTKVNLWIIFSAHKILRLPKFHLNVT